MTSAEIAAYNAGVTAVLDLARASTDALLPKLKTQPTRINFAIGVLDGIADEGRALLIPLPPHAGSGASNPSTPLKKDSGDVAAAATAGA